ncbi:MAG: D-alanine--D-alanine ligase [Deltaproteobacteria bacterium]|mgnify:CR=1 FL=1|nr:D-alanine--D-alanine ligase [Deltaproteobacteria bacterium]RLB33851.1 MAG: D-alanine--D-alanine ligase [Deltaproteobacteria bacterium]
MAKLRVALLAGGWSGEREVSLKSGDAVFDALDKSKYEVSRYDPRDDLETLVRDREQIDLAFVLLHGKLGEDGSMQGFLDILDIPYVGSGVLASAMSFNKKIAKERYRNAGLSVVEDVVVTRGGDFSVARILGALGPLTVVKPVAEGSSLGASICHSHEELEAGIEKAFSYGEEVMVERYIKGRELTCCILGNRATEALPVVEIVPNPEYSFFDYEAKYRPGATKEICPAPLTETEALKAQSCARRAHEVLKCRVWSRTDMILEGKKIYVLETNTLPGMTETSLVPLAARAAGIPFSKLLDKLIDLSLEEKGPGSLP